MRADASGVGGVLGAGARYALSLVSGRAEPLADRWAFARAVGGALRPHFFVFSGGAALAGASMGGAAEPWRVAVAAGAAALGWGVGQLLNDLQDIAADAVDAPHRPAVRGLLPLGPTALVALSLALLVTLATVSVHRHAVLLAGVSALLIGVYGAAKRVPLAGNVAHGALMATAAVIGLAAAEPDLTLAEVADLGARVAVYVGAAAALYLQANYEKDRVGDARAGNRTLAHVLGVRTSAALRIAAALGVVALALDAELLETTGSALVGAAALCVLASAWPPLSAGTERASLSAHRFAIHATTLFLLAPATRLSVPLALGIAALGVLLVERAFTKTENP